MNTDYGMLAGHYRPLPKRPSKGIYGTRTEIRGPVTATNPNDPCPCGSKLKFKRCHGRRPAPAMLTQPDSIATYQRAKRELESLESLELAKTAV